VKFMSWCLPLFLLVVFIVLVTPVMAKGPVDKITIEGPDLAKPIEITDPDILSRFDPWAGQFIGTGGPLAGPPSNIKEPYLVKFYLENLQGELTLRYMFYYYFNPTGTTGYIYLPGPGEPYYQINTGTIIRGKSDGQWHKSIPGWDNVMSAAIVETQGDCMPLRDLDLRKPAVLFWESVYFLQLLWCIFSGCEDNISKPAEQFRKNSLANG